MLVPDLSTQTERVSDHVTHKIGPLDFTNYIILGIGWLIAMTAILAVPVVAIYQLGNAFFKNKDDLHFPTIWTELTQPTETWRENAKKAHLVEPINGNDVEMKEGYDNPAANLE